MSTANAVRSSNFPRLGWWSPSTVQRSDAVANGGTQVTANFTKGVNAPVQYGENLRATALYFGVLQLIAYQRLAQVFADVFHAPMSVGTLANIIKRGGAKAAETMAPVREALVSAKVAHADEPSGAR